VDLKGGGTLSAPIQSTTFLSNPSLSAANYPAIISGKNVTRSSGSKTITGTIFAARPKESSGVSGGGTVDLNATTVHGPLIGNVVQLQGGIGIGSTLITDDYPDPTWIKYYAFMPGFIYPSEMKTTVQITGTWRELQ